MKIRKLVAGILCMGLLASNLVMANELPVEVEKLDVEESMYTRPDADHEMISADEFAENIYYDLKYCGEESKETQILHLFLPNEGNAPYPVLISVHGGVWASGNSINHMVEYTQKAALAALDRGYAVACVDYSIRTKENLEAFPNMMYEIKAAIRYLRSVAEEYSLDPEKFALIGESAGGHLVDMAAVTMNNPDFDCEEMGNMEYSSDVQAVISQYTVVSLPDNLLIRVYNLDKKTVTSEELNNYRSECCPLSYIDGTEPPMYFEAGTSDDTVDYSNSVLIYNALVEAGVEGCELHLYEGMNHAVSWFQAEEHAKTYLDWLDNIFER